MTRVPLLDNSSIAPERLTCAAWRVALFYDGPARVAFHCIYGRRPALTHKASVCYIYIFCRPYHWLISAWRGKRDVSLLQAEGLEDDFALSEYSVKGS